MQWVTKFCNLLAWRTKKKFYEVYFSLRKNINNIITTSKVHFTVLSDRTLRRSRRSVVQLWNSGRRKHTVCRELMCKRAYCGLCTRTNIRTPYCIHNTYNIILITRSTKFIFGYFILSYLKQNCVFIIHQSFYTNEYEYDHF